MKDLEQLLGELQAEGHLDSQGTFTSSEPGALARLSQRLLPDPSLFWLKLVQALVESGAVEIRICEKMGWFHVEADTPSRNPRLDMRDWVGQAWRSPNSRRRHLAVGLLGAWQLFSEIHLDWGDDRLLFRPPTLAPEPLETPPAPFGTVRLLFKRKHWRLITDLTPHSDRLFACPVPVREIPWNRSLCQARAYGRVTHSTRPWWEGTLGAVCQGRSEARLVAPDSLGGSYPVFFIERTPQPSFVSATKPDAYDASWYPIERMFLMLSGDGPGAIIPVEAGVGLNPVQADLGMPGLRCVVSVEGEGLHTDLSQFNVRRDQALDKLVDSLRSQAPFMTETLLKRLRDWKPSAFAAGSLVGPAVGFVAGGVLGIGLLLTTGIPAPFHFLALPGAFIGSRWSAQRWHREALARLRARLGR